MSTKSVSKAFQKMHVEKKSKTLSDTLREWFDIIFRWAIPEAVQDMPPRGMYFVGISSIVTATLLFLIIVWATYGSNINTIYLSPNENSGICESVARPISGVYLADVNGSWNSNIYYDSSLAIYQFRFQELRANASFWKEMIGNLSISIDLVAAKMKIQPLDINLLWWLVWEGNFAVQGTTQYFGFYSDPTVVFNRQYVHGVISNVVSDCNATSSSKYDVGSYYLSLTYSFSEFMSNPRCTSVMNPYTMGYDPVYDGDEFTLSYDVRSLVTALAINGKILGFGTMRPLVGSIFSFIYNNVSYLSGQFQNSRFPGMDPLVCTIDETDFDFVTLSTNISCFFSFKNGSYAVPLFNTAGASGFVPSYCECYTSDGMPGPGLDPSGGCNIFNFLTGLLVFDNFKDSTFQSRNPYLDMMETVPLPEMSKYAYTAMFIGAVSTYENSYEYNTTEREAAYSFCNLTYTSCSVVVINSFDMNNRAVSNFFYELLNGSCSDSVTISNASMTKLSLIPPSPLIEKYFNCRKTPVNVLSTAVGITVGNINALVPILFLIFVQGYYIILYYEGRPTMQTYTKEERDDALKALSLQLLMMRDNRLPATRSGSLYKAYPHIHGDTRSARQSSNSISSTGAGTGTGTGSGAPGGRSVSRQSQPSDSSGWDGMFINDPSKMTGNISILRLLTDELMENAYINVYFSAATEAETKAKQRLFRKNSMVRRKTLQASMAVDVEGANGNFNGDAGNTSGVVNLTDSPLHASVGNSTHASAVSVLNSDFDATFDTIKEFDCSESDNGTGIDAAKRMIVILDSLINRLIATAVEGAEEDFWEIAAHSAVLHKIDLDLIYECVLRQTSDLNAYVSLLMKIYQLIQVHIRISYGCDQENAHSFDHITGYIIGTKTYTVADLEQLYNSALALAIQNKIKLEPV